MKCYFCKYLEEYNIKCYFCEAFESLKKEELKKQKREQKIEFKKQLKLKETERINKLNKLIKNINGDNELKNEIKKIFN